MCGSFDQRSREPFQLLIVLVVVQETLQVAELDGPRLPVQRIVGKNLDELARRYRRLDMRRGKFGRSQTLSRQVWIFVVQRVVSLIECANETRTSNCIVFCGKTAV